MQALQVSAAGYSGGDSFPVTASEFHDSVTKFAVLGVRAWHVSATEKKGQLAVSENLFWSPSAGLAPATLHIHSF